MTGPIGILKIPVLVSNISLISSSILSNVQFQSVELFSQNEPALDRTMKSIWHTPSQLIEKGFVFEPIEFSVKSSYSRTRDTGLLFLRVITLQEPI